MGAPDGANRRIYDEFMATGAMVAGSESFEPAGGWGGDHHGGLPIYVLSRRPAPAWAAVWPAVRCVRDVGASYRRSPASITSLSGWTSWARALRSTALVVPTSRMVSGFGHWRSAGPGLRRSQAG